MANFLLIAQIVLSIIIIILILLQQRGTALGSAFGESGGFYATRRGLEKKIFWLTIISGALFIILSVLNLTFSVRQ